MLKVEIWSDFACPFCYIGKRRFEGALEKFAHKDEVEVIYKSYQLAPDADRDIKGTVYEGLAKKYDISLEKAIENMKKPVEQAKQFGLELNFDRVVQTNTLDAHRLAHFAAEKEKATEMTGRLMKAYLTDGLHIGDHEVLADLAVEVGLDRTETLQLLASEKYTDKVHQEREQAKQVGLTMIPHFMINGAYYYFGGQTSDAVLESLQQAWNKDPNVTLANENNVNDADGCTADGCAIPGTN